MVDSLVTFVAGGRDGLENGDANRFAF